MTWCGTKTAAVKFRKEIHLIRHLCYWRNYGVSRSRSLLQAKVLHWKVYFKKNIQLRQLLQYILDLLLLLLFFLDQNQWDCYILCSCSSLKSKDCRLNLTFCHATLSMVQIWFLSVLDTVPWNVFLCNCKQKLLHNYNIFQRTVPVSHIPFWFLFFSNLQDVFWTF